MNSQILKIYINIHSCRKCDFFGGDVFYEVKSCSVLKIRDEKRGQDRDYKALFEEKPIRKRARPDKNKSDTEWIWDDEKVINN